MFKGKCLILINIYLHIYSAYYIYFNLKFFFQLVYALGRAFQIFLMLMFESSMTSQYLQCLMHSLKDYLTIHSYSQIDHNVKVDTETFIRYSSVQFIYLNNQLYYAEIRHGMEHFKKKKKKLVLIYVHFQLMDQVYLSCNRLKWAHDYPTQIKAQPITRPLPPMAHLPTQVQPALVGTSSSSISTTLPAGGSALPD